MSEFPKFELVIVIIEARKSKPMMLVCLQVLGYRWLVSCWWVKSALSLERNGNGSAMWKMIGLCIHLTALLQFPLQVLYGSYLKMVLRRLVWLYKQPTFCSLLFSSLQHYVMSVFFVWLCLIWWGGYCFVCLRTLKSDHIQQPTICLWILVEILLNQLFLNQYYTFQTSEKITENMNIKLKTWEYYDCVCALCEIGNHCRAKW